MAENGSSNREAPESDRAPPRHEVPVEPDAAVEEPAQDTAAAPVRAVAAPTAPLTETCPTEPPAPDTVAAAAPATRDDVSSIVDSGIQQILRVFESKLAYDAAKQQQVDRLHAELQGYRGDIVARMARPLVHGLVRLHGDVGRLATAVRTKPSEQLTPERVESLLEGVVEDIEILLEDNGIASFREPPGPFNPHRQRVLRTVPTDDADLAGTVAESLRPGFERGSTLIEKERVAAFQLTNRDEEPVASDEPETDPGGDESQDREGSESDG